MKKWLAISLILLLAALSCIPLACDTGTSVPGDAVIDGEPATSLEGAAIIDTTNARNIGDATTPTVARVFPSTSSVTTDAANLIWKASATAQVEINAAIDALGASGGVIELSAGTFACANNILLDQGGDITIRGLGPGITNITYDYTGLTSTYGFIVTRTAAGSYVNHNSNTIENLTITETSGADAELKAINTGENSNDASHGEITVRNVELVGCGMHLTNAVKCTADNNYVHDIDPGLEAVGSHTRAAIKMGWCTNAIFTNNVINDSPEMGLHGLNCDSTVVTGNTVKNCSVTYLATAIDVNSCRQVTIHGNNVSSIGGILSEAVGISATITGNNITSTTTTVSPAYAWYYDQSEGTYTNLAGLTLSAFDATNDRIYLGYWNTGAAQSKFLGFHLTFTTPNTASSDLTVKTLNAGGTPVAVVWQSDRTYYSESTRTFAWSEDVFFRPNGGANWAAYTLNGQSACWVELSVSAALSATTKIASVGLYAQQIAATTALKVNTIGAAEGSTNAVTVSGNTIRNAYRGIYIDGGAADSIVLDGNIVTDCFYGGLDLELDRTPTSAIVSNSSFINCGSAGSYNVVLIDTASDLNMIIDNCIIDGNNNTSVVGIKGNNGTQTGCRITNTSIRNCTTPQSQLGTGVWIRGCDTILGAGEERVLTGRLATGSMGAELISNGDFAGGDTNWTVGANWSTAGEVATHTDGSTEALSQDWGTSVVGTVYQLKFTFTRTAGSLAITLAGTAGTTVSAAATVIQFIPAGDTTGILTFTPSSDFAGTIDDVSVCVAVQAATYTNAFTGYQLVKDASVRIITAAPANSILTAGRGPTSISTASLKTWFSNAAITSTGVIYSWTSGDNGQMTKPLLFEASYNKYFYIYLGNAAATDLSALVAYYAVTVIGVTY